MQTCELVQATSKRVSLRVYSSVRYVCETQNHVGPIVFSTGTSENGVGTKEMKPQITWAMVEAQTAELTYSPNGRE